MRYFVKMTNLHWKICKITELIGNFLQFQVKCCNIGKPLLMDSMSPNVTCSCLSARAQYRTSARFSQITTITIIVAHVNIKSSKTASLFNLREVPRRTFSNGWITRER